MKQNGILTMLIFNSGCIAIVCNKCGIIIRDSCIMMTKKSLKKHGVKRHYCGNCIQKRIGAKNE